MIVTASERKRLHERALAGERLPPATEQILAALHESFLPPPPRVIDDRTAKCEKKLWFYLREMWPILEPGTPFVDSWHIGCYCEHLEALSNLEIRKLLVNFPRRRGKSVGLVAWFTWEWAKNPWTRWAFMSYSAGLSERDSNKCRDVIQSDWYQSRWGDRFQLRNKENAATRFSNDKQGYRIATTPGGKTIGFGGEYNVGDDLVNFSDAWSLTTLRKTAEIWTQGVSQSVNDPRKARFMLVMQRLNEDDPAGVVMREELGYETLILPEEYEPCRVFFDKKAYQDSYSDERHPIFETKLQRERPVVHFDDMTIYVKDPRTQEGELLCPDRFPREIVEQEKKSLGAFGTASQKQQRPGSIEGNIFKKSMFRRFRKERRDGEDCVVLQLPESKVEVYRVADCRFFQCIDTAQEIGEHNDWTVNITFALTPGADLLVWFVWRYRIEVPYQFDAFRELRQGPCLWNAETKKFTRLWSGDVDDRSKIGWPRPLIFQAIEKASSGVGLIQQGAAHGMPFKVLIADQSQIERIGPIASEYAAGKVYHLEGAEWLGNLEGELLGFPTASHDDQVMVMAYGGILVQHDAILRQGINRELLVSDRETVKEAEKLSGTRSGPESYKFTLPGVGDLMVDFPD